MRHPARALLAFVALTAVLALVVGFLRAAREADPVAPPEPVASPATTPELPRAEPLARVAEDVRSSAIVAEESAPSETDAAELDPDDSAYEPVDVLVVDHATGEPVAGAEVRWANVAELEFRGAEAPHWRPDPIAHFANAPRTTSDATGLARIDARVFPGTILARHGVRFGRAAAEPQLPRPIVVAIAPDLGVAIQVVDEAGRPVAGVPVCLRAVAHLESMRDLWIGTTEGPEGLVHIRQLDALAPGSPRPVSAYACLDVVLRESVCAPVDLAHPSAEPVRLVLPPCGSLALALRDTDGRPASAILLHLGLAAKADEKGELRWASRGFEADVLREGFALYRFVGLGLDLHAVAQTLGGNVFARGAGPRTAGETARLELALGRPSVAFVGRLVTQRGEPIRDRPVQIGIESSVKGNSNGYHGSTRRTDADGRFRVPTLQPAGGALRAALRLTPIGRGPGAGQEAQTVVEYESAPADADLGDVVVRELPSIGSGVVVDESGALIAGAQLSIEVVQPGAESRGWHADPLVRAASRPDGAFEIRASLEPTRVRASAKKAGFAASEPVEFEPGRSDVRLVLPVACELRGRALLDPGVDPRRVRVRLLVPGAPIPAAQLGTDREVRLADDGTFRIAPIAAGRYDLDFRILEKGVPFQRIDGLDVARGGGSVDARLDAIDLRGRAPAGKPR